MEKTVERDSSEDDKLFSAFKSLDVSKLKFEKVSCDFCGCEDSDLVYKPLFVGLEFRFCRCKKCGLIYQNPLLDMESREYLYETREYWNFKDFGDQNDKVINYYSYISEIDNRQKTDNFRIKWITSRMAPNSRVLDIACGDGFWIDRLNKSGYQGHGLDISTSIISVAKEKYGVEVAHGDVEKEWPFTEPFDAITCYTISNFTKPSLVLKNISKNLRDGGYFFFNIPDCDNFISKLLGDRFYVYRPCAAVSFSKKTFTAYLEDNGFEIERMVKDTQQVPIKRLFGMIGLPSVANMLNFYGVGNLDFKIALPTSYIGCAVLKKNKLP